MRPGPEYAIRLRSGRVVVPAIPTPGFAWYASDGRFLGGSHGFEWAAHKLASGALGGVATTKRFGDQGSVVEFFPIDQVESLVAYDAQIGLIGPDVVPDTESP